MSDTIFAASSRHALSPKSIHTGILAITIYQKPCSVPSSWRAELDVDGGMSGERNGFSRQLEPQKSSQRSRDLASWAQLLSIIYTHTL